MKLLLRPDSGTRPEMRSVPVEHLARRRAEQVGPALLVRPLHDGVLIPQARFGVLDQDQLLRCQLAEVPCVAIVTLLVPVTFNLACNLSPAGIDRLVGWAETVRSRVVAEFYQPVVEFPLAFREELVEIEVQSDGLILCLVNGIC